MRITLAQINSRVGDLAGNLKKIETAYRKAVSEKSDLIVFPELALTGYPPLDLLENEDFVKQNLSALRSFAGKVSGTACILGYVGVNEKKNGKKLLNSAAFMHEGGIKRAVSKSLLPTYDIFDEERYFEPSAANAPVLFKGLKIGLIICEDIWADTELLPERFLYGFNPLRELLKKNADLVINISASPFYKDKRAQRIRILSRIAAKTGKKIIYVNSVGANDELIFDGGSFILDEKGGITDCLGAFTEEVATFDLAGLKKRCPAGGGGIEDIRQAIVLGIRDYFRKQGFKKAVLGLSGGIDSAVVAVLACEALGPENVLGVLMPSPHTSRRSCGDAEKLALNLGIKTETVPIGRLYDLYAETLGLDAKLIDLTLQNLQSRIRGTLLMAFSNKRGFLVLATGNKSEIAMGYCTLYGDTAGALAPIGDVLKTDVYKIAALMNKKKEIIPDSVIKRPPTAELKPGQKDRDDLPPYDLLDRIIKLHIEENLPEGEICRRIKNRELVLSVIKRIENNEYKRKQLPPALKISEKSFGSGRKMPIVKSPRRAGPR